MIAIERNIGSHRCSGICSCGSLASGISVRVPVGLCDSRNDNGVKLWRASIK